MKRLLTIFFILILAFSASAAWKFNPFTGKLDYYPSTLTEIATRSHADMQNLLVDDHTQYALLSGRATPQTIAFGTAASATTGYLTSTSHATKGSYSLNAAGTIVVDELNTRVGIGGVPTYDLDLIKTITGGVIQRIKNSSAQAASYAQLAFGNNQSGALQLHYLSSNWVTSGENYANGGTLVTNGAGGLSLSANNASGVIRLYTGGSTERWRIDAEGDLTNTGAEGTAYLHLKAGTATASSAPVKFTAPAALLATPEALTLEPSIAGDDLNFTITTGAARKGIVLNDGTALTSGRVPFATTNGRLTDDADITFSGDTLTVTGLAVGTTKITSYNGIATEDYGVSVIVDGVHLTGQTADIAATNITNAGTAGNYRVAYYLQDTTADITAGAITLTFNFTDDAGATAVSSAALPLTAVGRTSGMFYVRLASGNLTYSVTHTGLFGTSQYRVDINVERIS